MPLITHHLLCGLLPRLRKNNKEQRWTSPFDPVLRHMAQNAAAFCGLYGGVEARWLYELVEVGRKEEEGRTKDTTKESSFKNNTLIHTTPKDSRGESGDVDTAHTARQSSGIAAGSTR